MDRSALKWHYYGPYYGPFDGLTEDEDEINNLSITELKEREDEYTEKNA